MCSCRGIQADTLVGARDPEFSKMSRRTNAPLPPLVNKVKAGEWDLTWVGVLRRLGMATYLRSKPESSGGETEAGGGEEAGVGEVEG